MISRARSRYYNEWHCVYSHEPHYWVYKLCQTLCNPMRCSTPGFPILHCLLDCSDLFPLCWWCYLPTSFPKLLVHTNKTHQTIMYSFSVRIVIIKVSGWGLSWWSCGLRPWASAGGGGDSIPGQGSKIPHPEWWGKKRKKVKKPLKREREVNVCPDLLSIGESTLVSSAWCWPGSKVDCVLFESLLSHQEKVNLGSLCRPWRSSSPPSWAWLKSLGYSFYPANLFPWVHSFSKEDGIWWIKFLFNNHINSVSQKLNPGHTEVWDILPFVGDAIMTTNH